MTKAEIKAKINELADQIEEEETDDDEYEGELQEVVSYLRLAIEVIS